MFVASTSQVSCFVVSKQLHWIWLPVVTAVPAMLYWFNPLAWLQYGLQVVQGSVAVNVCDATAVPTHRLPRPWAVLPTWWSDPASVSASSEDWRTFLLDFRLEETVVSVIARLPLNVLHDWSPFLTRTTSSLALKHWHSYEPASVWMFPFMLLWSSPAES